MTNFSSFDEAKGAIRQLIFRQSDSSGNVRLVKVKYLDEDVSLYCYMTPQMAVEWADKGYVIETVPY